MSSAWNYAAALAYVKAQKTHCVRCGIRSESGVVMEFHHPNGRGPGEPMVSDLVKEVSTKERIDREIAQCQCLCQPCHTATHQNIARGIPACRRGHPWTDDNTIVDGDGRRRCRTCRRLKWQRANECKRKQNPTQRTIVPVSVMLAADGLIAIANEMAPCALVAQVDAFTVCDWEQRIRDLTENIIRS